MKNLVPVDSRSYSIVVKLGGVYYMARKVGNTWNTYVLINACLVPFTKSAPAPYILLEYGECLHYEKAVCGGRDIPNKDIKKYFSELEVNVKEVLAHKANKPAK